MPNETLEAFELQELNPEQSAAMLDISNRAGQLMEQRWGSGFPEFTKGEIDTLPYHNLSHAETHARASAKIVEKLGFPQPYVALAELTGRSHDIDQGLGRGKDEASSANWLGTELRKTNLFPESFIQMAEMGIVGTEPVFDEKGVPVGQVATEQEYPDEITEKFAKAIACGDFAHLYSPAGPYLAQMLYCEINKLDPQAKGKIEDIDKVIGWFKGNVGLLANFKFALPEAEEILTANKVAVQAHNDQLVANLTGGEITTWEQLTNANLGFMEVTSASQ